MFAFYEVVSTAIATILLPEDFGEEEEVVNSSALGQ